MPTMLRLFVSSASLGVPPPAEHLATKRESTQRAWGMISEKARPAARAALGTVMAVRSLHQPQMVGFYRNENGSVVLVWGCVSKPVKDEDGMYRDCTMEELRSVVRRASADKGSDFTKYGHFHLQGAMRSPDPISEPVEDLLNSALAAFSVMEISEELSEEQRRRIERRLDSPSSGDEDEDE